MALTILNDNPNSFDGLPEDDEIHGLGGNDTLRGFAGNDLIYGNQGDDIIDRTNPASAEGNDTIFGGQGNDFIGLTAIGSDLIYGNLGNDTVLGGTGNNTIFGGQGDDRLFGNDANDLIYGNLGSDEISAAGGNDTVFGGQDVDHVVGGEGDDLIYGNLGNDLLEGGIGVGTGNDTIFGGQGNDVIVGENQDDHDLLFGNLGADVFDFTLLNASGITQATADHIGDFSHAQGDKVRVQTNTGNRYAEAQGDSSVTSVDTAFAVASNLIGAGANQGNVVFVAGPTDGYLFVDKDNSGGFGSGGDFAIVLDHLNSTSLFGADDLFTP